VHLAAALRAAGHAVRILSQPEHRERVRAECGIDLEAICTPVDPDAMGRIHRRVIDDRNPASQLTTILKHLVARDARRQYRRILAALSDCELLVAHATALVSQEAAIARGIPVLGVTLTPGLLPHPSQPPMGLPDLGRGNRLAWRVVDALAQGTVGPRMRRVVRHVGGRRCDLSPVDSFGTHGVLVAADPALAPGLAGRGLICTGHWHRPPSPVARLPAAVEAFLAEGEPPVYVGFGSMEPEGGAALAERCVAAARRLGWRVVLQRGWAGLTATGADVCVVDHLPHDLLLRHCRALVHHCGAGTTHAAARSGRPSIPVPFLADQPYWAGVLRSRGAATAALPRHRLTVDRLARALAQIRDDPALARGAARLAARCDPHGGCARALDAIARVARRHAAPLR